MEGRQCRVACRLPSADMPKGSKAVGVRSDPLALCTVCKRKGDAVCPQDRHRLSIIVGIIQSQGKQETVISQ